MNESETRKMLRQGAPKHFELRSLSDFSVTEKKFKFPAKSKEVEDFLQFKTKFLPG